MNVKRDTKLERLQPEGFVVKYLATKAKQQQCDRSCGEAKQDGAAQQWQVGWVCYAQHKRPPGAVGRRDRPIGLNTAIVLKYASH